MNTPQPLMISMRLMLAALLLLHIDLSYSTEREVLKATTRSVPDTYFGIHNIRFHNSLLRPSDDFKVWRLWDTGTAWGHLQPTETTWEFTRLDLALAIARERGYVDLVLTLGRTPAWASKRPDEKSFYGPGGAAPPRNIADFRKYVRTIAERYRSRIQWYEIWNEPASLGMYTGTVEEMVQLARAARQEVLAVDPAAKIICPSPAKRISLDWYAQFLEAGGGSYCDVMGYHFYTDSSSPEDRIALIKDVKALLARTGHSTKPLWDTESGLSLNSSQLPSNNSTSNPAHIARWMLLTWASGVERFYWYAWDHDSQGFIDSKGNRRSEEIQAYKQVRRWMNRSVFRSCERETFVWTCYLDRPDAGHGRIVWTANNSTHEISVGPRSIVETLGGQRYSPQNSKLVVSGDPQWITGE